MSRLDAEHIRAVAEKQHPHGSIPGDDEVPPGVWRHVDAHRRLEDIDRYHVVLECGHTLRCQYPPSKRMRCVACVAAERFGPQDIGPHHDAEGCDEE